MYFASIFLARERASVRKPTPVAAITLGAVPAFDPLPPCGGGLGWGVKAVAGAGAPPPCPPPQGGGVSERRRSKSEVRTSPETPSRPGSIPRAARSSRAARLNRGGAAASASWARPLVATTAIGRG